jgi:excisionase family DNA binding protein
MYIVSNMKTYSTGEVARIAGIHKLTVLRWLRSGVIPEPKRGRFVGRNFRIWTQRDLNRMLKHKQKHYRKGRGRKPKKKKT